jgi:hypothetical protein
MKVEIQKEIVDGIRERQKANEASCNNLKEAGEALFEASRAYCDAKTPDGFRGYYLMPLCVLIESTFKVWLDFLGGSKKELLRLQTVKKEKQVVWERMMEEKDRKEKEFDVYIGEYLKSVDPEYRVLAEKFTALSLLLEILEDFHNLVVEAVCSIEGDDEEEDKITIRKELTEIDVAFLNVKKSIFTFMLAASSDIESDLSKYYGDLLKALEAVKRSRGAEDEYSDFHRIADRSYSLYEFVDGQKDSLENKLRLRIDAVKAECLRES